MSIVPTTPEIREAIETPLDAENYARIISLLDRRPMPDDFIEAAHDNGVVLMDDEHVVDGEPTRWFAYREAGQVLLSYSGYLPCSIPGCGWHTLNEADTWGGLAHTLREFKADIGGVDIILRDGVLTANIYVSHDDDIDPTSIPAEITHYEQVIGALKDAQKFTEEITANGTLERLTAQAIGEIRSL